MRTVADIRPEKYRVQNQDFPRSRTRAWASEARMTWRDTGPLGSQLPEIDGPDRKKEATVRL